jgi:hypothetical protein
MALMAAAQPLKDFSPERRERIEQRKEQVRQELTQQSQWAATG